ncbi:MAG: SRPBCC family protein [Chryseolinea sp.]
MHSLRQIQILKTDLSEAWRFFSNPSNLATITPASMNFRITSLPYEGEMYAGQIINYKVTVAPAITVKWITEITHVRKPFFFVDEQRRGPYRFWHHQHHFRETDNGVEMIDEVNYEVPFGPLGRLVNHIFVGPQLERIFEYRTSVLKGIFPVT